MKFEITIPCYNEEKRLEAGFASLCEYLCRHAELRISVVFADNGSTDATPAIAQRLVAASPVPARYLRLEKPGLALALRAAWDSSVADIVGYCDADMATDVAHLDEVCLLFEKNGDLVAVNGSRNLSGAVVTGRSAARRFFSRGLYFFMRLFSGVRATDVACGFKFFRRAWYVGKRENIFSEKYFLGAELLAKAEREGARVVELPVRWRDRPGSRIRLVPTVVSYWKDARKLRRSLKQGKFSIC